MLGAIGFLIAALVIAGYAVSSSLVYTLAPPRQRYSFALAYTLLAIAMLFWMVAVASGGGSSLPGFILASDVVLIGATLAMINVKYDLLAQWWLLALLIAGAALLTALRAYIYPPTAFVSDGLLYFNLPPVVLAVFLTTFTLIWLPASAQVVRQVMSLDGLRWLQNLTAHVFTAIIIVTGLFLSARRPVMVILLFIVLVSMFAGLLAFNLWLQREYRHIKEAQHG